MRYHFILMRMAKNKNPDNNKGYQECGTQSNHGQKYYILYKHYRPHGHTYEFSHLKEVASHEKSRLLSSMLYFLWVCKLHA